MENSDTESHQPQPNTTTKSTQQTNSLFTVPVIAYTNYLPMIEAKLLGVKDNNGEKTRIIPSTLQHDGVNVYIINSEDKTVFFQAPISSVTITRRLIGSPYGSSMDEYVVHANNTSVYFDYRAGFKTYGFIATELKKYGAKVKIFLWQKVGLSAALIVAMIFVALNYLR